MRGKVFKLLAVSLVISLLTLPLLGCGGTLTLTLDEPEDGAIVLTSFIILKGTVSDTKATVTVNDIKVVPDANTGEFQNRVDLSRGQNVIRVMAVRGNQTVITTVTIDYTPPDEQ